MFDDNMNCAVASAYLDMEQMLRTTESKYNMLISHKVSMFLRCIIANSTVPQIFLKEDGRQN